MKEVQAISYSKTNQRKRRDTLKERHTELNHVENKLAQQPNDHDLQTAAMKIRTELELISPTLPTSPLSQPTHPTPPLFISCVFFRLKFVLVCTMFHICVYLL